MEHWRCFSPPAPARSQPAAGRGLARLTQIAWLVLFAAALAMAAAMGAVVWQRRRRLADLKLTGITSRKLWKALLLESALLLGVGCSVGAAYGLYGARVLDRWLSTLTGFPVDTSIALFVALLSLGVVMTVAFLIATIPGYFASRVPADVAFQEP